MKKLLLFQTLDIGKKMLSTRFRIDSSTDYYKLKLVFNNVK